MNHAHAAKPLLVRIADKAAHCLACVVASQTMQIDLALNAPLAFAQFLYHVSAHTGSAKTQVLVGIEQAADVKLVA